MFYSSILAQPDQKSTLAQITMHDTWSESDKQWYTAWLINTWGVDAHCQWLLNLLSPTVVKHLSTTLSKHQIDSAHNPSGYIQVAVLTILGISKDIWKQTPFHKKEALVNKMQAKFNSNPKDPSWANQKQRHLCQHS